MLRTSETRPSTGSWKSGGVINLYSDDPRAGGQVRDALGVARGDVISLLDDDDEFLPEKLERVYAAFRNGVDYYHNGRVVVNEAG